MAVVRGVVVEVIMVLILVFSNDGGCTGVGGFADSVGDGDDGNVMMINIVMTRGGEAVVE